MIHKTLVAERENRKLVLRGSGKALRQFLFVDDFAKMLLLLLNSNIQEELVICAPKEEVSIQLLTDMIVYLYEFENGIVNDLSYSDGQYKKTADSNTFNKLFPILEENGVYIIEDIETSYWTKNGLYGYNTNYGYKHPNSIVEIFKNIIA